MRDAATSLGAMRQPGVRFTGPGAKHFRKRAVVCSRSSRPAATSSVNASLASASRTSLGSSSFSPKNTRQFASATRWLPSTNASTPAKICWAQRHSWKCGANYAQPATQMAGRTLAAEGKSGPIAGRARSGAQGRERNLRKTREIDRFWLIRRLRGMAGVAGLEPVTSAVTGQRSNQLSYTPAKRGAVLRTRLPESTHLSETVETQRKETGGPGRRRQGGGGGGPR